MQGQSPYIVNLGLFYQREGLQAGLLYNTLGKRIVGIGRSGNGAGGTIDNDVPDMYETARQVVDLTVGYRFGRRWEVSGGVRDLLAQPMAYQQYPRFTDESGNVQQRTQTTKYYRPGRNFSVGIKYNL
jgi:outer membrane receptor protein involved in Fe transport